MRASELHLPTRALSTGTRAIPEARWIDARDEDWDDMLTAKASVLRDSWTHVVAVLPGSEQAQAELLALVRSHLNAAGEPSGRPSGTEPAIVAAARLIPDDLCLLEGPDHLLTAGVVAFPNRWRVPDKIGLSPLEVHAPVAGYAATLGRPVDRLLTALRPGRVLERRNWSLLDDPALFQPTAGAPAEGVSPPDGLWVRAERQSLRRLPETGAIVFTIRTRQWPLAVIADRPDLRAGLADALRDLPDDLAVYKSVAIIRPAVLAWLSNS